MKKISLLIIVLMAFAYSAQAQLYGYKWRVGMSAGTTNYYGDIRPFKLDNFKDFTKFYQRYENYSERLSYQASLEYALGNTIGLMLSAGTYQFGSSDRFVKNDGTLIMDTPTFDRALNFQTNLYDAGLSLVFKPDNNWLLSGKSFISPYFTVGLGMQHFEVFGDLLDANGDRYNYINESLIPDGTFETNLSELRTELPGGYDQTTLYANLGLGIRFKITKTFELFAQSDFKMAATDYLDDVSEKYRTSYDNSFQEYAAKPGTNLVSLDNPYRGMEDGKNDWYIYHGVGIKFSFGANKKSFDPPVITQRYTYIPTELEMRQVLKQDTTKQVVETVENKEPQTIVNNYFTVIQLPGTQQKAGVHGQVSIDSTLYKHSEIQKDSLSLAQNELTRELNKLDSTRNELETELQLNQQDTLLTSDSLSLRIQSIEAKKSQLDSTYSQLNSSFEMNQSTLDSLNLISVNDSTLYASIDTAEVIRELIIYPGQVSRILFNSNAATLSIDSLAGQSKVQSTATLSAEEKVLEKSELVKETVVKEAETQNESEDIQTRKAESTKADATSADMISKAQFDAELAKLRRELISAQSSRDSAMLQAYRSNLPTETVVTQRIISESTAVEEDTEEKKKFNWFRREGAKDQRVSTMKNDPVRDAIIVGGTAATTAAITSGGDNLRFQAYESSDSTLRAQIEADSEVIDSLTNLLQSKEYLVSPDTVKIIEEKEVTTVLNLSKIEVYFNINSATLSEEEILKLEPISDLMDQTPNAKIELIGFADNTGSIAYNLKLTQKRVDEVLRVLTEQFNISKDSIEQGDGGLIIRGSNKMSIQGDRKVEIRFSNSSDTIN